jgi:hypothetical protein
MENNTEAYADARSECFVDPGWNTKPIGTDMARRLASCVIGAKYRDILQHSCFQSANGVMDGYDAWMEAKAITEWCAKTGRKLGWPCLLRWMVRDSGAGKLPQYAPASLRKQLGGWRNDWYEAWKLICLVYASPSAYRDMDRRDLSHALKRLKGHPKAIRWVKKVLEECSDPFR